MYCTDCTLTHTHTLLTHKFLVLVTDPGLVHAVV